MKVRWNRGSYVWVGESVYVGLIMWGWIWSLWWCVVILSWIDKVGRELCFFRGFCDINVVESLLEVVYVEFFD